MNEPFDENPYVAIGKTLIRTSRRRFQLCELLLERLGIGAGQMPVLSELDHHKQMTQRELAEHTHVTAATISGTLKRMERSGLVQRSDDESDARVSIVRLTKKGMDCSEEAVRLFTQTDTDMLSGFSEEEMAQLLGYLQRMCENVNQALEAEMESNRTEGDPR
ncbi:MAG: MarR family transcriptional regulator [Clostridia bacterium]|nr:MarR family transcriptional regulator [Clostridia bacterium]